MSAIRGRSRTAPLLSSALVIAITACSTAAAAADTGAGRGPARVAGIPAAEALRLGERMYRDGIIPSGKPLKAVVREDIPLEQAQFTCAHCHQRSGFGSLEGTVRTSPITGTQLFAPVKYRRTLARGRGAGQEEILRPAYTDETLAAVMTTGVDPSGRRLNSVMPVYSLTKRDAAILVYYLKHLSAGTEPGVTDKDIRFATIVADDVPKAQRDAMLVPLRNFIQNWKPVRGTQRMMQSEVFYQGDVVREERRFSLAVWELKGPSETWPGQLAEYYRKEPVFAILGGIAGSTWEPIHTFCNENRIPAIFPLTDLPALTGQGGYTLYLSRGLEQEGAAAARYLHARNDLREDLSVVQVFRPDAAGLALSKAFQEAWTELGHAAPRNREFAAGGPPAPGSWTGPEAQRGGSVYVLWLNKADLPDLAGLGEGEGGPAAIIASSTLLGPGVYSLPEQYRDKIHLTYPFALPQERRILSAQGGVLADPCRSVEARMQALFTLLRAPLLQLSISSRHYRDYFLEQLEAIPDLAADPVPFPRLSFGTGQRYASKGCYVVQLSPGPSPQLVKRTEWMIP